MAAFEVQPSQGPEVRRGEQGNQLVVVDLGQGDSRVSVVP
jgi:hypothetical protein